MRSLTAALLTLGFAAWQLAAAARVSQAPPDLVGPGLELYRGLVADLPPAGVIGFLESSDNAVFNTANYYVAQYALAPRIVLNGFDSNVRFVVTGVDPNPTIERDPRLDGYELAGVRDRGVRIFRRSRE
jgi:hypothetical protein